MRGLPVVGFTALIGTLGRPTPRNLRVDVRVRKPSGWDILLDILEGDGEMGRPGGDGDLGDMRDRLGDEALYDSREGGGGGLLPRIDGWGDVGLLKALGGSGGLSENLEGPLGESGGGDLGLMVAWGDGGGLIFLKDPRGERGGLS